MKYTEAILSSSTRKLLWFEIAKTLIAVEKIIMLFIMMFGTLSFRSRATRRRHHHENYCGVRAVLVWCRRGVACSLLRQGWRSLCVDVVCDLLCTDWLQTQRTKVSHSTRTGGCWLNHNTTRLYEKSDVKRLALGHSRSSILPLFDRRQLLPFNGLLSCTISEISVFMFLQI